MYPNYPNAVPVGAYEAMGAGRPSEEEMQKYQREADLNARCHHNFQTIMQFGSLEDRKRVEEVLRPLTIEVTQRGPR